MKLDDTIRVAGAQFALFAVITFESASDHYKAYVKNLRTRQWQECNDSTVKILSSTTPQEENAYTLFYERITI